MLQFHLPMSAPELSTCAASFSMVSFAETSNTCTSQHAGYVSKLFEVEGCGNMSIPVFIVVVPKCSSSSESVMLKAVDCDTESC